MTRTERERWLEEERWEQVERGLLPAAGIAERETILARLRERLADREARGKGDHDPVASEALREAHELSLTGYRAEAELPLARALMADLGVPGAWALAGALALEEERWSAAGALAGVGWALSPGAVDCAQVAATAAEREGKQVQGREWLERAAMAAPRAIEPRIRLLRQHVDRGAWQAAMDLADQLPRLAPDRPLGWGVASWARQCAGDVEGALGAAFEGISRCGGSYQLVERVVASAAQLPNADEPIEVLAQVLSISLEAELALLEQLVDHGLDRLAGAFAELLRDRGPEDAAPLWAALARAYEAMGQGEEAQVARRRLDELATPQPDDLARQAALLRRIGRAPSALALLCKRARADQPLALALELARAHAACGDPTAGLRLLSDREDRGADRIRRLELMLSLAVAAPDWRWVEQLAEELLAPGSRDTADGYVDPWPLRALSAAAALHGGDEAPRNELIERAPFHPFAVQALLRAEIGAGHPLAEIDTRRLRELGPPLIVAARRDLF